MSPAKQIPSTEAPSPPLVLNRVISSITALGPGRRLGIWVQGCAIACRGCASVDTWDPGSGFNMTVEDLAAQVLETAHRDNLTGITLTGGEPVDQSSALSRMLDLVAADSEVGAGLDVLLFTGYALSVAEKRGSELIKRIDTLIAGPYRADRPSSEPLVASSNQRLVQLTERGLARAKTYPSRDRIQMLVRDGELTLVGLPEPGDLSRFREKLAARGVTLGGVSWEV